MAEQRDFVDYNQPNGGDTGQANLDSIQPISDGEAAKQIALRRVSENIRSRTEIIRDEIEELKYYRDYEQLMIESSGNVTWGGASDDAGTGFITSAAVLRITPLLAPLASTKGTLTIGTTNQVTYTISASGYATQGMNAILVEHRDITGTTLSALITPGPVKRIVVFFDLANATHTPAATAAVVTTAISTDSAGDTVYGITGKVTVSSSGTGIIIVGTGRIEGTADAELHVVTAADLGAISLAKGDGIAIWYRYLIEPSGISGDTTDPKGVGLLGGRAESSVGRGNTSIPSGSLFKTSTAARKIPGAIPICRVANNGQLIFFDGTRIQKGETISFASPTSVANAALTAHISNLATVNGAGIVGYNGSPNWADGVQAIAAAVTVEAAIDEIVSDLAAISTPAGALHIGVDATAIFGTALTALGGGGALTTNTTVRAALDQLDTAVIARRGFTAICTDNVASVGGDFNVADVVPAINTLAATGGAYILRRGAYTVSTDFTTSKNTHLIGEDVTKVTLTVTKTSDVVFVGANLNDQFSFENIFMKGHATLSHAYKFTAGTYTLRNCRATAGAFYVRPAAAIWLDIDGLVVDDDTPASTKQGSVLIEHISTPDSNAVTGTLRRLRVTAVPSGLNTSLAKYAIAVAYIGDRVISRAYAPLVIENSTFDISTGFGDVGAFDGAIALITASHQPQIYRNCLFRCNQVNASITPTVLSILNSSNVEFDNCTFIQNGYGKVLSISGSSTDIRFRSCKFYTSPVTANYAEISVAVTVGFEVDLTTDPVHDVVFEDCYVEIRFGTVTGSTGQSRIEIGSTAGVQSVRGSYSLRDFYVYLNYTNITQVGPFTLACTSGSEKSSFIASNVTIDLQGKRLASASVAFASFGSTSNCNVHINDLHLRNVTEPDTSAGATTLTDSLIRLYKGRINGGSVNGTPAGTNVSAWKALFELDLGATVENVIFYGKSTTTNRGRCILAVNNSKALNNTAFVPALATSEDTFGWFFYTAGVHNLCSGNTIINSAPNDQSYDTTIEGHTYIFLQTPAYSNRVANNSFSTSVAGSQIAAIHVTGVSNTVVANTVSINTATAGNNSLIRLYPGAALNTITGNTSRDIGAGTLKNVVDNIGNGNQVFGNSADATVLPLTLLINSCTGIFKQTDFAFVAGPYGNKHIVATAGVEECAFALSPLLPNNATITEIRVSIRMNSLPGGGPSDYTRMRAMILDALGTQTLIGQVITAAGVLTQQYLTLTTPIFIDKTSESIFVSVSSCLNFLDDIFGIEVDYELPRFYTSF